MPNANAVNCLDVSVLPGAKAPSRGKAVGAKLPRGDGPGRRQPREPSEAKGCEVLGFGNSTTSCPVCMPRGCGSHESQLM